MVNSSSQARGKTVFIFGAFKLESIEDKIIALGLSFERRSLNTLPFRWEKVDTELKQLIASGNLVSILLLLSKRTLLDYSSTDYLEIWNDILISMNNAASLIFIDENNFAERFFDEKTELRIEGFNSRCKNYIKRLNNFIKEARNARLDRVDGVLRKTTAFIFYFKIVANEIGIKKLSKEELEVHNEIESNLNQIRMILEAIAKSNDEIFLELIAPNLTELEKLASVTAILFEQFQKDYIEGLAGQLQRAMKLLRTIQESDSEIVPYHDKKEISLRVHHFLDEIDRGIFLHLYVPNGRYQEDQLANFLRLFESYLQRVEQLQFSIETRRTMHGTVYEFKSQSMKMNLVDMEVALSRFEDFMSLCQYDQEKAEAILLKKGVKASDARRLLTKYFKEYRRLLLDIEHEREIKVIELRHKYESEALDLADGSDLEVPQVMQPTSLLSLSPHAEPINVTITNSSVNINPGLQSYIEQAIYGDIHYTTEDKELLQLFVQYAQGLEAVRLRSDLEQLKDASLPDVERKTAKQKIGGFLAKVAPSIGQAALSVLTAYLEKVLTGS